MKDAEETDLRAQVFRVDGSLQESCRARSKQQAIEKLLVVQDQGSEPVGKRKNQVHVRNVQEFLLAGSQPPPAGIAETPRAMPVAAAVIGDGHDMAASGTTVAVPAERRRATAYDGGQHLPV